MGKPPYPKCEWSVRRRIQHGFIGWRYETVPNMGVCFSIRLRIRQKRTRQWQSLSASCQRQALVLGHFHHVELSPAEQWCGKYLRFDLCAYRNTLLGVMELLNRMGKYSLAPVQLKL